MSENSATHYLALLENDKLSMILFDASILQISYEMKKSKIVKHRYCYVPAPCRVDLREVSIMDLYREVEAAVLVDALNEPRRSVLRFDFDPEVQTVSHPAVHLHVNSGECRLPLRAPLEVKDFVHFLVKFMYADHFPDDFVRAEFSCDRTLSDLEERGFHLSWRASAAANRPKQIACNS